MTTSRARRGRPTLGGILAAIGGLALFIYFLQRAGVADVADGIRRLSWAFLLVVALGGLRHLIRAAAWMRCMDDTRGLGLWRVFQATVAGDSLGNLTPLGLIVGEPAKGLFLRDRSPLWRTLPALAVENLFYTVSAMLVIASGIVVLLVVLRSESGVWLPSVALLATLVLLMMVVHAVIWNHVPVASAGLAWLQKRRIAPRRLGQLIDRVRHIEDHIFGLYPRDPGRLLPVAGLELSFHFLAVVEIYLVLSLIGGVDGRQPTLLEAFIFESTNRLIAFAFKFVPMRIGVDEAGTGMFAELLAFGTATGVTLAIIRKARMLVWIAFGTGALVRRGLTVRDVLAETASTVAIVVMARPPHGERPPKTRLARAIPADQDRRRLYAAFLADTIAACRQVEGSTLRLAHTPDAEASAFDTLGLGTDQCLRQRGADLGERERALFDDLFAAGFDKVVVVGSDLPTLPTSHVRQAIAQIDRGSVVLGPSEDGGYYLIGLAAPNGARPLPDLFSGIRWSTPSTLDDTCAAAGRAGIRVKLVPSWFDVDDEDGLARLRRDLDGPAGQARAPETARVLGEILGGRR